MSVIVNAKSISIYFAGNDNTVTHRFTTRFSGSGNKPQLIYYRYDSSLSDMLASNVHSAEHFTVQYYLVDITSRYVYFNNYVSKNEIFHLPNSNHFQSIVRIMQGCQCEGQFKNKDNFPESVDLKNPQELAKTPPTFGIQEDHSTIMRNDDYGVILQPVGEDKFTYRVVIKLHGLSDNFTVVRFSYDLKEPAYIDDESYHTLKLYNDKESRVSKVDIHDNVPSIDLNLLLQEISMWIITTSPEARIRDSSISVQVAQPSASSGGSGNGFYLRLRIDDASCPG